MSNKYDLQERTAKFAENVIELVQKLPHNLINNSLVSQIVRSSSSIGANYMEATEGESKKDFVHKICICKKEIKETQHWLRIIAKANTTYVDDFRVLWKENQELLLIFSKIIHTSKKNSKLNI